MNAPRTCFVCRSYTAARPCAQCDQVTVCATCANTQPMALRAHQAICFSITAPTNGVERVVSRAVGGLGAVHQYVSSLAWAAAERDAATKARLASLGGRMRGEDIVAGVIFNDFPAVDELDADGAYVAGLARIAPSNAPYIVDARFLWQPTMEARWAAAAVYKRVPAVLMGLAGVRADTMAHAEQMLALRTDAARVNYHFLRAAASEIDAEVVARAVATAQRWFRLAVLHRTLFPLGHVWHMVQDSFSPAHTDRSLVRTDTQPYGTVRAVFFFGDQTDGWHSSHESWLAVSTPGSVGHQRVDIAVLACRDILLRFVAALDGAPLAPPSGDNAGTEARERYAAAVAVAFGAYLREQVFALEAASLV